MKSLMTQNKKPCTSELKNDNGVPQSVGGYSSEAKGKEGTAKPSIVKDSSLLAPCLKMTQWKK